MNITVEDNKILKDGEQIAVFNPDTVTVFSPKDIAPTVKGHITTILMEKHNLPEKPAYDVAPLNKEKKVKDRTDLMNKRDGDKTPAYMKWYRENHTEAEYEAKYGPLRKCDPELPDGAFHSTTLAEK